MKSISGKKLGQILERNGWKLVRIKGSHHRYQKDNMSISIPIHGNQDVKIGLLKSVMKQANLTESDLI
ncbi:type II toxin-antitoxin system HicA family toxin [Dactylococcopsis salina]|uniref:Periplasmic or secreted lipoprotein n=1 Tax=Dactylococcopsis salina (strain PCC 8305) TaxID=13035 RepID=K9YTW8_DACS8|nr:type II toxin-antitoxin system HicA family toxin [Dactylococcopsis salina]AFZ50334.1 putative periplasmic or secreted lipoprotein [Dactylococcopsis salina PCC 8305]